MGQLGLKGTARLLKLGLEVPVTAAAEGAAGPFPLNQEPNRNGLHPPGGESPGHLFPEERGQGVPHKAIQNPPGFLGMDQLHVQVAGLIQGLADGLLGDLVKHHALHRHLRRQQLEEVPTDAFAFPVFVRRQEQLISTLEGVLEFANRLLLVLRDHVQRLEIRVGVHTEVGPFLPLGRCRNLAGVVGKVADMPHGGFDFESLGKEATDGLGLRGALNDDEGVRH